MRKFLNVLNVCLVVFIISLGIILGVNNNKNEIYAMDALPQSVIVYGESEKEIAPDIAKINLTIKNYNNDATKVKDAVFEKFSNLKELLIKENIKNENISLKYFNVSPKHSAEDYTTIIGYNSVLNFEIKIENLTNVDKIINLMLENNIEYINSVCYEVSNFEQVYNDVLKDAMNQAKEKAESILGKSDFKIKSIIEQETYNGQCVYRNLSSSNEIFNNNNNITIFAKVKLEVE